MKTILIIDDEYDILNSLEMVFSSEGYAIRTAHDGSAGLERLAEAPCPNVIISDIMMPVMDGYALVKAIRAKPEFNHIPIILMSAANLDESRVQTADYDIFIRKPFSLDLIISEVGKLTSDNRG